MNNETFSLSDAAQLAVVTRSGFVESRHAGSAVVLDADGEILRELGNPRALIYPRSCLKPLQALAVMTSGVQLLPELSVIAMASHSGTADHLALVQQILNLADLDASALQCPADIPADRAARSEVLREGLEPSPMFMNCSGKHAAMLLACVVNDWPIETYLEPTHPLQLHIKDTVQRFTGEKISVTGVDGCGAPVFAVTIVGLARATRRLITSSTTSPFPLHRLAAELYKNALAHGWILDGQGRPNTVVINELGVFAKFGAEGVMIMGAPNGTSVALKVLDGNLRAATVASLELLVETGALARGAVDRVLPQLGLAITGGSEVVGEVRATIS
ncbi:asparaginase [Lysinibacter cavernae]|uniref:L-asparaginase II n=1 Tax=Lysinibacter cavernae TaxID=1640652 RepID=A0A7X5QYC7_9MICO|nr:asparaginase [Lysinibacter cavernae]NIH52166.1 L-asparaginase II [Lysinibacter cavernae]